MIDTVVEKRDRMSPQTVIAPVNPNAAALLLLQVIVQQAPHM